MTARRPFSGRHARKAQYWIARLASGNITAAEMDRLHAWLARSPRHRAAFQYQRSVWQALDGVRDQVRRPAQPAARPAKPSMRPWWRQPAPLVAALALALVALPLLPRLWLAAQADYRSAALPQTLTLDDGSRVSLDADSAIAIDYSASERRVRLLRGQAWFDVAPQAGRPFRVAALGGVSEDVSTAFVVAIADRAVHTSVEQGRVRVLADGESDWVDVQAGQQVRYARGEPVQAASSVPVAAMAAWRHGDILLDDVPLKTAIERIARYRGGRVWVIGDLDDRPRISGVFRIEDADAALLGLAQRSRLQVARLPAGGLVLRPE